MKEPSEVNVKQVQEAMRYWGSVENVSAEFLIGLIIDQLKCLGVEFEYVGKWSPKKSGRKKQKKKIKQPLGKAQRAGLKIIAEYRGNRFPWKIFRKTLEREYGFSSKATQLRVTKFLIKKGYIERDSRGMYRIIRRPVISEQSQVQSEYATQHEEAKMHANESPS